MKIGIDVDGVLADFSSAYVDHMVKLTGKDLFPLDAKLNPVCWDWDLDAGYTKEEQKAAFDAIAEQDDWWTHLQPFEHNTKLLWFINEVEHDYYFVTSRRGVGVKTQTEWWLEYYCGIARPTVLITGHGVKGIVCKALGLDAYVDDNYDNVLDCRFCNASTRTYLLDKSYNRIAPEDPRYSPKGAVEQSRIPDLATFFAREGIVLPLPTELSRK